MQSQPLDLMVARAQAQLRLVEHALHNPGPWTMEYEGVSVPVSKFVREHAISFVAHFPPLCPLSDEPDLRINLYCRGHLMTVIALEGPLDEDGAEYWYDIEVVQPTPVL